MDPLFETAQSAHDLVRRILPETLPDADTAGWVAGLLSAASRQGHTGLPESFFAGRTLRACFEELAKSRAPEAFATENEEMSVPSFRFPDSMDCLHADPGSPFRVWVSDGGDDRWSIPVAKDFIQGDFWFRTLRTKDNDKTIRSALTRARQKGAQPLEALSRDAQALLWSGLDESQIRAVEDLAASRIGFLKGAPGTGKTTMIARLLLRRLLVRPNMRSRSIELVSPTGRAAHRMTQCIWEEKEKLLAAVDGLSLDAEMKQSIRNAIFKIPVESKTVQELLASKGGDLGDPDDARGNWIVVDEAAMLGLALFAGLFEMFPNSSMTFVGDPNQLPSIDSGSAFRSYTALLGGLAGDDGGACVRGLEQNHRYGNDGELADFAVALASGDSEKARRTAVSAVRIHAYGASAKAGNPETWDGFLEYVSEGYACLKEYSDPRDDDQMRKLFGNANRFRVLCASEHGSFGTERLNAVFRERFGRKVPVPAVLKRGNRWLHLESGEMGFWFPDDPENLVVFRDREDPSRFRRICADLLPELVPAFAMTVHGAQGDEWARLAIVLPDDARDSAFRTRELLYTAVTRVMPDPGDAGEVVSLWTGLQTFENTIRRQIVRIGG